MAALSLRAQDSDKARGKEVGFNEYNEYIVKADREVLVSTLAHMVAHAARR